MRVAEPPPSASAAAHRARGRRTPDIPRSCFLPASNPGCMLPVSDTKLRDAEWSWESAAVQRGERGPGRAGEGLPGGRSGCLCGLADEIGDELFPFVGGVLSHGIERHLEHAQHQRSASHVWARKRGGMTPPMPSMMWHASPVTGRPASRSNPSFYCLAPLKTEAKAAHQTKAQNEGWPPH